MIHGALLAVFGFLQLAYTSSNHRARCANSLGVDILNNKVYDKETSASRRAAYHISELYTQQEII